MFVRSYSFKLFRVPDNNCDTKILKGSGIVTILLNSNVIKRELRVSLSDLHKV